MAEVTRFDRAALLALIAAQSSTLLEAENGASDPGEAWAVDGVVPPFVLAAIARDTILNGPALGGRRPRTADLARLGHRYLNLEDRAVTHPTTPAGSLDRYLVRIAYEQFPYQLSPHNELARSWALFGQTASALAAPTMTPAAWRASLGCGLGEFLRTAFACFAAAAARQGWVDLTGLAAPEAREFLGDVTSEQLFSMARSRLSASPATMCSDLGNVAMPRGLEKYRYNPLTARPYVPFGTSLLAPSVHLAAQRAWPNSLYYDRVEESGFADDLGGVFEAYVGRQLRVLEQHGIARVFEKVVYDRSRGEKESVDWYVAFPEVLLLIEAKAGRLTAEARQGGDRLTGDVERTLGKAYEQIGNTSDLLDADRAEFEHLPTDLPRLGLAVTLEPYWLCWGVDQLPVQPGGVPALPVSCSEIEGMVSAAIAGPIDDVLLRLTTATITNSRDFNAAFTGAPKVGNPVLDNAFNDLLR